MSLLESLTQRPMRFLRAVLRANAAFSILSGIVMIVGGTRLGAWLGRESSVAADGVVLLVFAAVILWITRSAEINLKAAAAIIVLDALWVVDTARQIITGQYSTAGNWFYGVATLVVLDFAVMQLIGLLKAGRTGDADGAQAAAG